MDFSPSVHRPVARFEPPRVGTGGKSGKFSGVGWNPQEMPIEAEGREDIDISSTRRWPEASADKFRGTTPPGLRNIFIGKYVYQKVFAGF